MARKGYLKIAVDKETKKGQRYVLLGIVPEPDTDVESATWMSLFDLYWAGGTENEPSPYDIRRYADKDAPPVVVYESEEKVVNERVFVNCRAIRPDTEQWFKSAEEAINEPESAGSGDGLGPIISHLEAALAGLKGMRE